MKNRVEVLHGVNFDVLDRRDPEQYGGMSLQELEVQIKRYAVDLDLGVTFFQSNFEGEFVEYLHRLPELADAAIINAGAWTHYSYAIRDALEVFTGPKVEVHLSAIEQREEWRRHSVIADVVTERISGHGVDGYREAMELLQERVG